MATYTPPPYFPQSSLSPPDEHRYRKFKLMIAGGIVLLLAIIGGAIGSYFGSRRFPARTISILLAIILTIAGAKLIFTR